MDPFTEKIPAGVNQDSGNDHYDLSALIEEQGRILEMITSGKNLSQILQAIVLWAEKESKEELLASILLLDEKGERLLHGAAPSLPAPYNEAIHGVAIGPSVGSCGTAAYRKEKVIVENIETDPLWSAFKHLALPFGLKACWSTPLIGRNKKVLGTFAMYYNHPKKPSSRDMQVIRFITSTTVMAIEWKNAELEKEKLLEKERKTSASVLQERQRLFHLLMDAPAMVSVMSGPDHVYELANGKYMQAIGSHRNILGKPVREALPELAGQGIFELLDNVYKTGEPFYGNEILVQLQRDSELEGVYFNFVYQPIRNEHGTIEGIFVHAVDVTQLVKAKYKAQESEEMFRSFVLNSPAPIGIYLGKEMRIQTANDAILKAWEKDRSVIGGTFREALPELEGQPFFEILQNVYTTGIPYHATEDMVYLMRNGVVAPTYWNFSYTPLRDEKGEIYGIINTGTEVTELVSAKQKLAAAQESLESAIDIAELGTLSIHLLTNYITYSSPIKEWFGLPADGTSIEESLKRINEEDRAHVLEVAKIAIESAGEYAVEFMVVNPVTNNERIIQSKGKVVKDESGNPISIDGVCRDITLQKQTEKELEKEVEKRTYELQEANNELNDLNENLKQFVYIASHDLQEPLRKINMFSDMLQTRAEASLDGISQNYLSKIMNASQRMIHLIKDLLDYSRTEGSEKPFGETNLNMVVNNVIEDYEMLIHQKNAEIRIDTLPVVNAVPLQMNQLFYNLIGNALKFGKKDIAPVIDITSRRLSRDEILSNHKLNHTLDYIEILVSDNGIGFNQQFAEQIFVIFQRLHSRDKFEGTGIGLALCKKIVDNHQGVIYAEGEDNVGAKFHVILPIQR